MFQLPPSQIHIIFKTLSVIKGNYQFREEKLIKVFVNLQSGKLRTVIILIDNKF